MEMLIEKLSQDEKNIIDYYRKCYAPNGDGRIIASDWAPIEKILTPWATAKKYHLYQLLGNQIMISKEVSYEKNKEELLSQMFHMKNYGTDTRHQYSGKVFLDAFFQLVENVARDYNKGDIWKFFVRSYVDEEALINNVYDSDVPEFPLPSGKSIQVKSGTKPMRVLAKIARAYDLPGFEDFRIAHSLILNQKRITGTMTLSIHPLDYMTMSDNDCSWESCMSWCNEGSYRQGTVEMMNSPIVIIAYMNATKPYNLGGGRMWSNKKWRQLFVVDSRCIVAIKSYPYQNDELTIAAMDWICELAKENLHWDLAEPRWADPENQALFFPDLVGSDIAPDGYVKVGLDTGYMYNDLGTLKTHLMAPAKNLSEEDLVDCYYSGTYLVLPYSGVSECMVCGGINPDFDDESCLICDNCIHFIRCEYCDERISPDEGYSIDGRTICHCCYDNHVFTCNYCGEERLEENMYEIRVLPRLSEEHMRVAREAWLQYPEYSKSNYRPLEPEKVEFNYYIRRPTYRVCRDNDCITNWKNTYLKPGAAIHSMEVSWDRSNFVYLDELTEEALEDATPFRWKRENETLENYNLAYIGYLQDLGCNFYPLLELGQF